MGLWPAREEMKTKSYTISVAATLSDRTINQVACSDGPSEDPEAL